MEKIMAPSLESRDIKDRNHRSLACGYFCIRAQLIPRIHNARNRTCACVVCAAQRNSIGQRRLETTQKRKKLKGKKKLTA